MANRKRIPKAKMLTEKQYASTFEYARQYKNYKDKIAEIEEWHEETRLKDVLENRIKHIDEAIGIVTQDDEDVERMLRQNIIYGTPYDAFTNPVITKYRFYLIRKQLIYIIFMLYVNGGGKYQENSLDYTGAALPEIEV